MRYVLSDGELDRVRAELRRNAELFDRPGAYVAGVEDAIAALVALARDPERTVVEVPDLEREPPPGPRMI